MKKFVLIILIVFGILILVAATGGFVVTRGLEEGAALQINSIDLSTVENGNYEGLYSSGRWSNSVMVSVKDHTITDIQVTKTVLIDLPEVREALVNSVFEQQNTDVDVISGATVTSKAYLMSIENALTQ
ncbi:FMN-binding protein [Eubacteriaceae bacterium ES3]|nr:FMN-binding protein [Eubacteriaceae bacterium ES3]